MEGPKPSDYQAEPHDPAPAAAPDRGDVDASRLTPGDILGPFYRPGSPWTGTLCQPADLTLEGTVKYADGTPVEGYIEFWQADRDGQYDVDGPSLRGIQKISGGVYVLRTTRPGFYDISEPGSLLPHLYRTEHIHAKVWVKGRDVLTTQLYFSDGKYNCTDPWHDARREIKQRNGATGHYEFDFVVPRR